MCQLTCNHIVQRKTPGNRQTPLANVFGQPKVTVLLHPFIHCAQLLDVRGGLQLWLHSKVLLEERGGYIYWILDLGRRVEDQKALERLSPP